MSARLPLPVWARPAAGGLALSLFAVPLILLVGARIGSPGRALGILGGGYGAAQIAITGADWLPTGWHGAELLLFLCARQAARDVVHDRHRTAAPATSARRWSWAACSAARSDMPPPLLLHDPSIDPGAFALVGMGTFYGGLAHVPVSSLVMVCELAGQL